MRFFSSVLMIVATSFAQTTVDAPDLRKVQQQAMRLLLNHQENYVPDPPVGRFRTRAALEAWREKEEARLKSLRKKTGKPREWPYEGVYRVGGRIPPGYRVGGTAIATMALMAVPGLKTDRERLIAVRRGLGFILDSFDEERLLDIGFLGSYDVRGWAHAYGLWALVRALEDRVLTERQARRARRRCRWLIKALKETEIEGSGGWNYARGRGAAPSSFMTAVTLLALYEASAAGFKVDPGMVERALAALGRGRDENGAVLYAIGRGGPGGQKVPGAVARMAVVETALYLAGRSSVDRVRGAVRAFFKHWDELEKRRGRQGTHSGPYGIAPYYFHFGHTYAAKAIELLPENERPELRKRLQDLYWRTRENDGGWNDRIFPRSKAYSTAMVLLGLTAPLGPPLRRWTPRKP